MDTELCTKCQGNAFMFHEDTIYKNYECEECEHAFRYDKKQKIFMEIPFPEKSPEGDTSSPDVDPSDFERACNKCGSTELVDVCGICKECYDNPKKPYQVCEVVCMQNVVTVRLKDPAEAIRFAMKMLEEKDA